jgi:hypothetical protein
MSRWMRSQAPDDGAVNSPVLKKGLPGHYTRILAAVAGLVALTWFLVRVIPKPSRASYPCQRAAFPLATGKQTNPIQRP